MSMYSVAAVAFAVAVIFFVIGFFVGEAAIKEKCKEVIEHYDRYKGEKYVSVVHLRRMLRRIIE